MDLCHLISVLIPLSTNLKYRTTNIPFKQILVEEFTSYYNSSKASDSKNNELEAFIKSKIEAYSINNAGSCQHCTSLDIDLALCNFEGKTCDEHLREILNNNKEYNSVISKISFTDKFNLNESQNDLMAKRSVTMTKELFNKLPNLVNIFIEGLKLSQIDEAVKECKYLKNVELINNDFVEFPDALIVDSLEQFIIENSPIQIIPKSLFGIKMMKSIFLSMLNLSSLPNEWSIDEIEQGSNLKSLVISQTKINSLPNNLIKKNDNIK